MISVEHLTKYYGEHLALDDVSFEISEGHVYGFLGPNGAGKSTTMNIITGCLSASDGKVMIDGYDIFEEPREAKSRIGYLPEHPPLYMGETVMEYLRFVAEAKGLRGDEIMEQIAEVAEKVGIKDVINKRISTLSKGYRQRTGIAQALLANPRVIILDEPTVGLDPIQIIEIRDLIKELGKEHTVIFSSHILSEVQAICDRIIMISGGKLVAFGTPEELQMQLQSSNEIVLSTNLDRDKISTMLKTPGTVTGFDFEDSDEGICTVRIFSSTKELYSVSSEIFALVVQSGGIIYEMRLRSGSLEDVFIELSENGRNDDKGEEQ